MRKYLALLLMLVMWSCLDDSVSEMTSQEKDEKFVLSVPSTFSWNNISKVGLMVNIKEGGTASDALDNTVIELYDEDDVLLDALTVLEGTVEFNVRIPAATSILKISSDAANYAMEIAADASSANFEIPDITAMIFARVDIDGDGVFDAFDASPTNPNVSIRIDNKETDLQLKSTQAKSTSSASYVIFEDLWPAKGDYDFNDLVSKTTFSWTRGKKNYIEEISGVCEVEWIGAGLELGLGFELFETKGSNLYYLGDVITEITGASADESVTNGIIAFERVQDVGINQVEFTLKIEDKQLKDFLCVPYLFRTQDRGHQVRPFGAPPTQGQDMSLFRSYDDASPTAWLWDEGEKFKYPLKGTEAFYRSAENHPWGIEFITKKKFKPSEENKTMLKSYPGFREWAESGGKNEKEWYDHPE